MATEFPIALVITLNIAGWPVILFGLAWAFTQMPVTWFNPGVGRAWEQGGRFYERVFGIKRWIGPPAGRRALVRRRVCQGLVGRS